MQRIIVLGAGTIGSYYGALLSRGNDVLLVGRTPHIDAINSRGLTIRGEVKGNFRVQAADKVSEVPPNALILLTTKAYDSEEAVSSIKDKLLDDTVILVLQNGLGNEDIVKRITGTRVKVLRGLLTSGVESVQPGTIAVKLVGETVVEDTALGKRIADTFNEAGLKTRLSDSMQVEIWRKLVMNCVINPLSALLRVVDKELASPHLAGLKKQIVDECLSVAEAEGVTLEADLLAQLDRVIPTYGNYSSMCQDIMRGAATEIEFLNGRIVELGKRHNIPTPTNVAIVSLIKFLEGRK